MQEMFDERRRRKASSSFSNDIEPVSIFIPLNSVYLHNTKAVMFVYTVEYTYIHCIIVSLSFRQPFQPAPSPRKLSKSLSNSTSGSSRASGSVPLKLAITPTTGRPNSLGSSSTRTSSVSSPNGSNQKGGSNSKQAQPPPGPAYSIAAGQCLNTGIYT